MFTKRAPPAGDTVTIHLDGTPIQASRGDTLAAVLLARGILVTGASAVTGAPRAPYCMIGSCFGCLVEIEGQGDRQACLVPVREGLRVRCRGAPRDPTS
jgi:predicted molibdopterin-dependent oxidoreductase YjgC